MATPGSLSTSALTSKPSLRKLERKPPTHDGSRDSLVVDQHDAYLGEGLVGVVGLGALERLSGADVQDESPRRHRKLLDYLAIDGGEKYLDDVYQGEDNDDYTDGEDGDAGRHHSISYHAAPSSVSGSGRAAVINPHEVDSLQLGQIVAEEAELKQRTRAEKELAWQKVRQLLIEEEEKAWTRNDPVKLLDSLARPGRGGDLFYNRSVSSDVDAAPIVDSSLAQSQVPSSDVTPSTASTPEVAEQPKSLASHMDRVGNKISQFLHRGHGSDDDTAESLTSRRLQHTLPSHGKTNTEGFVAGKSSVRLALLATLEQVTRTCQRTELSEASMARISAHVASINQIAREDMYKNPNQQKRGFRRLSNTQWSKNDNESSDHDDDVPPPAVESPSEYLSIPSAPPAIVESLQAKASPTVLNSFKAFESAQDLGDTLAAYKNLLKDCGLNGLMVDEPWHVYCHIKAAVYIKLSFRHKQLFKLLDTRLHLDVYKQRPALKKRVCIVGAGPVGLRAAVEAALLGSQVVVLEKRENFSRENMLHLWPWVVQDLTSLGAKVLFSNFCKSSRYFHVSTRQLQVILLKVALLLGVTVYAATDFQSLVPPTLEENGGNPFFTVATLPQIPVMEFTAVLGASGTNDKLAEPAGITRSVFCREEALGVVCYFPNLGTSEECKVKEFSWTAQLKHPMLAKLRDIGLDLENIVYYRGEMHYLVMTPKRQNLLEQKVLKENFPEPQDLVQDENINKSTLHEYIKRVVDFAGIPRKTDFTRVSLFDFSSRTRADRAATVLTSQGKKLYVGLIGDSLLEPLWHESVGTCRGFLSALDGVWMVAQIGRKADEQLLADRELAYRVMERLSGRHRDEMQKNVRKYTVDPASRYMVNFPKVV